MHAPDGTMAQRAPGLVWPSLPVTVYVMAGAWPAKPAAGVKVAVPLARTDTAPAGCCVVGSATFTRPEPAG
jgi:hypothetical protein